MHLTPLIIKVDTNIHGVQSQTVQKNSSGRSRVDVLIKPQLNSNSHHWKLETVHDIVKTSVCRHNSVLIEEDMDPQEIRCYCPNSFVDTDVNGKTTAAASAEENVNEDSGLVGATHLAYYRRHYFRSRCGQTYKMHLALPRKR